MKTKEELKVLQKEYNSLTTKLQELSDDELSIVTGGAYNITFYEKEGYGPTIANNAKVGDFIAVVDYIGNRKIEVYKLESKLDDGYYGMTTKYTAYQDTLPNYTTETNVKVGLSTMAIIYKPYWIKE